jgi:hypothetical protein
MKINRTFSIDIDLAQKLKRKANQSETICRALRKYLSEEGEFDLTSVPTLVLLTVLSTREISPQALALVQAEYKVLKD